MFPLTLASDLGDIIPIIGVGGAFVVGIIWIVFSTIASIFTGRAKEATRRELAAYVAEGSMTAADAASIINAGSKPKGSPACAADFQPA